MRGAGRSDLQPSYPGIATFIFKVNAPASRPRVAAGTTVAGRPPRRSRRALLTHRAPLSGSGVEAVRHSLGVLIPTAIGTSIDAMAVGVTLALIGTNIIVAALSIGATTFALATLGIMVGRLIGTKFDRTAEACGWIVLILIGAKIGDPLRYCCNVDWVMAHAALADVAVR